jgi:hypothetical protein
MSSMSWEDTRPNPWEQRQRGAIDISNEWITLPRDLKEPQEVAVSYQGSDGSGSEAAPPT